MRDERLGLYDVWRGRRGARPDFRVFLLFSGAKQWYALHYVIMYRLLRSGR